MNNVLSRYIAENINGNTNLSENDMINYNIKKERNKERWMNSEIICVGTELLVGDILNTNVKYISEKLHRLAALTNSAAHCPHTDCKWQKET